MGSILLAIWIGCVVFVLCVWYEDFKREEAEFKKEEEKK